MEAMAYIIIILLLVACIWLYFTVQRHRKQIDTLKENLILEAKKGFEAQKELAELKGADAVRGKSIDDQAAYINDLLNKL